MVHVAALTPDLRPRLARLQMLHAEAARLHRVFTKQARSRCGRDDDGAEHVPPRALLIPHLVPGLVAQIRGLKVVKPVARCLVAFGRSNRLVTLVHDKQRPQPAILEPAATEELVKDAGLRAEPVRHARVHRTSLPKSSRPWPLLLVLDKHEHVLLTHALLLPVAHVPHRPLAVAVPVAHDLGREVGAVAPQVAVLHQLLDLGGVVEHHQHRSHSALSLQVLAHRVVRLQDRHQEALGVDGGETLAEHLLHPLVHPLQGLDHVG
mmetsp:Transcript_30072/g.72479  ORF Transcript_30072/g.72479 Transcript_30072/m.72479 type:complete len:264 (+) Transcript_30072:2358-3149(+)